MKQMKNKITIGGLAAVVCQGLIFAGVSLGADTSFFGPADSSATGRVSAPNMLGKGGLSSGLFIDGGAYSTSTTKYAPSDASSEKQGSLVESSMKATVFTGYGFSNWFELHLGVKASGDKISAGNRKEFFKTFDGSEFKTVDGAEKDFGTSFGGVILSGKFSLIDRGQFKSGLVVFAENGVGSKAATTTDKSENVKLGLMGIGSYQITSSGTLGLNLGYRSREAEEVGGYHLGNEYFYRMNYLHTFSNQYAGYTTFEGRNVRVARSDKPDSNGYLDYSSQTELAAQFGLTTTFANKYKVDVYLGSGLSNFTGIGNKERYYGLGLSVPILDGMSSGSTSLSDTRKKSKKKGLKTKKSTKAEKSPKKEEPIDLDKIYGNSLKDTYDDGEVYGGLKDPEKKREVRGVKKAPVKKEDPAKYYPEMQASDPDFNKLVPAKKDSDFERAQKRQKAAAKKARFDLDDQIRTLRENARKSEKQSVKRKISLEERRARHAEYIKAKREAEKKMKRKLRRELGSDYEITEEDANWTGLD